MIDSDAVRTITLDRSRFRNALTVEATKELASAVRESDARCIVIRSVGPVFCAGADLSMLRSLGAAERADDIRDLVYGGFQGLIEAISDSAVPVIAQIQGPAIGAGADLALACDLRVAALDAYIEETWIRLGVISALGAAYSLPKLIGTGNALDMFLTARRMYADECLARGVFQRTVPAAELEFTVAQLAKVIASRDPLAVAAFKRLIREGAEDDSMKSALARALVEQVPLIAREQFAERVSALQVQPRQSS